MSSSLMALEPQEPPQQQGGGLGGRGPAAAKKRRGSAAAPRKLLRRLSHTLRRGRGEREGGEGADPRPTRGHRSRSWRRRTASCGGLRGRSSRRGTSLPPLASSRPAAPSPHALDFLMPPSAATDASSATSSTSRRSGGCNSSRNSSNVLTNCPKEVVPLVLAYCGPQVAQHLSRTCRYWNQLLREESTWKVLCQELYKWNPGDPEPEDGWKDFYVRHPCVPVDYPTVEQALAASGAAAGVAPIKKVWLRPYQTYLVSRPIVVDRNLVVEAMALPLLPATGHSRSRRRMTAETPRAASAAAASGARAATRSIKSCHRDRGIEAIEETYRSDSDEEEWNNGAPRLSLVSRDRDSLLASSSFLRTDTTASDTPTATLCLHTRQPNAPVFWVSAGKLELKGVELSHACLGVDIWYGNAAIQVQPLPPGSSGFNPSAPALWRNQHGHPRPPLWLLPQQLSRSASQPLPTPSSNAPAEPPHALLERCRVTSQSGRGVVVLDGSRVTIRNSSIVQCAATGLYIGGSITAGGNERVEDPQDDAAATTAPRRSHALLEHSRVASNGVGSYYRLAPSSSAAADDSSSGTSLWLLRSRAAAAARRPSTIARGHSGVYVEHGECHVRSSVIRDNALTGISAVSEHVTLTVSESTLESNGTLQLETVPAQRVTLQNNRIVDNPPPPAAVEPIDGWVPEFMRHMDQP